MAQRRGEAHRVVLFTADCTQCSLAGVLDDLAKACRLASVGERPALGVFSARFSATEVSTGADRSGIGIPLYIAYHELPSLEDLYGVRSLLVAVTMIDLDAAGAVKGVGSLSDLLAGLAAFVPGGAAKGGMSSGMARVAACPRAGSVEEETL